MILVVAAMQEETKYIMHQDLSGVALLITGIGKVNAASKLSGYLATHDVEAIVNLGFAGASAPYHIRDLVIVKEATYHDFDLTFFGYEKGQVPGMPARYPSDAHLLDTYQKLLTNAKEGRLYTGDYFMTEQKADAFLVDMEGAALYQVAYQYQVPIISIKVISDLLGMEQHHDHYKKFESNEGAQALLEIFQCLFGGKNI
jgi:adenosylhomocysteine nucleosidase